MTGGKNFTKKDVENLVNLLNTVARNATFKLSTNDAISYVKLLNWAQTDLLPKVESHILEVKAVHLPPEPPKPKKTK